MNKQKQVLALYPNAICKRKRGVHTRIWRIHLNGRGTPFDGCGSVISAKDAWSKTLSLINTMILRTYSA